MKSKRPVLTLLSLTVLPLFIIVTVFGIICLVKDYDRYGIWLTVPYCSRKTEFFSGVVGDSVEYKEFYYGTEKIQKVAQSKFMQKVESKDVEVLKGYFEDFKGWLEAVDYTGQCSLDPSQIQEGDRFYIYTFEGRKDTGINYSKYDNYDLYYVDVDKGIMYYAHSNI